MEYKRHHLSTNASSIMEEQSITCGRCNRPMHTGNLANIYNNSRAAVKTALMSNDKKNEKKDQYSEENVLKEIKDILESKNQTVFDQKKGAIPTLLEKYKYWNFNVKSKQES